LRPRRRPPLARFDELLTAVLTVAIMLLVLVYLPSGARRSYSGLARVSEGDTLVVGAVRTRLRGIDAPEPGQFCRRDGALWRCAIDARAALHAMIAGRNVTCDGEGRDDQNRVVAVCRIGALNLNKEMVAQGWAVSTGPYDTQERAAKEAESGLWVSEFERPESWRAMFNGT
jgi:endonuclease YncB( thermonuclease family)